MAPNYDSSWMEIASTFQASLRSVGTACILASVGIYLHRRGFLPKEGKRTLALISQQVTIPLLLFTKIIHCNQDWSDEPCPDVTKSLKDVWMLLWWPLYVVGIGLSIGYVCARLSETPAHQIRAVMAACGFGNSTGLPITLLTVVHANFPSTSDLGRIDPCLFLSVYLLLYPVLQWGVGGWLLAPSSGEEDAKQIEEAPQLPSVLNKKESLFYKLTHRGMGEVDASLYMSVQESLDQWGRPIHHHQGTTTDGSTSEEEEENTYKILEKSQSFASLGTDLSAASNSFTLEDEEAIKLKMPAVVDGDQSALSPKEVECGTTSDDLSSGRSEKADILQTLSKIASRCLQPPVIGALGGIFVATFPTIRGILVDMKGRDDDAPLEWIYDGLYQVGQAAVPINMMILGCNLSASHSANIPSKDLFSRKTTMAIVIGKMIVMPIVGFLSVMFFRAYFWDIPDEIDGSFYLVALIVFLTPTANNVMVMVELSESGSKQGLARIIAWQYTLAPILLSMSMAVAVGMSDKWGN